MNVEVYLGVLFVTSVIVQLLTEGVKKAYNNANKSYSSNIIAGAMSAVATVLVVLWFVVFNGVPVNGRLIYEGVVLFVATWLCAMLGFDKIKQAANQLTKVKDQETLTK